MLAQDDYQIWHAIQGVQQEQKEQKKQLNEIQHRLIEMCTVYRESDAARREAVDKAITAIEQVNVDQDKRLNVHDHDIFELQLSKAAFFGGVVSIAAISSIISGIIVVMFGG